jgi:hypothetical protein
MSIISAEQELEFKKQIKDLTAHFRTITTAGDFYLTHVSEEYSEKYGIQSTIRTTTEGGVRKSYAAPAEIKRTNPYKYEDRNMMAFAEAYARGEVAHPPSFMLEECPVPVLKKEPKKYTSCGTVEKNMFRLLNEAGLSCTAVNPACSTMGVLKKYTGKIYLTSHGRKEWLPSVRDFISKAGGNIELVRKIEGVAYLGSHSPTEYPPGNWYYLLPNPYVGNDYDSWEVEEKLTGVTMRYSTKGGMRVGSLPNDMAFYVYNPATLRLASGCDKYLMVSNFPFPFNNEIETTSVLHTPWFLDDMPLVALEVVGETSWTWRCKGRVVYDVEGPGTYLSRRSRIVLPKGYAWAPLVEVGQWSFNRFSLSPIPSQNVRVTEEGGTKYVIYGADVIVSSLTPTDSFAYLNKVEGGLLYRDQDDNDVWLSDAAGGLPCSFLANTSVVILHKNLTRRIQAFSPSERGKYHNNLLPQGNYHTLNAVKVRSPLGGIATHVIHEPVGEKVFIFGTEMSISRYILQHRSNELQWSTVDSSRRTDYDLEGSRPRGTVEGALQIIGQRVVRVWNDRGTEPGDITHVYPSYTRQQVRSFLSTLSDVVLWRSNANPDKNQYVRTSSIIVDQESVNDPDVKNNYSVRFLLESVASSRYHIWDYVPTRDFQVLLKILRNMGWTVILVPSGREFISRAVLRR